MPMGERRDGRRSLGRFATILSLRERAAPKRTDRPRTYERQRGASLAQDFGAPGYWMSSNWPHLSQADSSALAISRIASAPNLRRTDMLPARTALAGLYRRSGRRGKKKPEGQG